MKNVIRIFTKGALCITLSIISVLTFGQLTLCDTCIYDYDHTWNLMQLDSVVRFNPQDQGEYLPCGSGITQNKNIIFIHGLGGSANSWAKQAVWTGNNYQTGETVVHYDAKLQTSFYYICDNLLEPQMTAGSKQVSDKHPGRCEKNDFAIAHSQGGIAARYIDWKWETDKNDFGNRSFYGLVTFATPHAGADIAITKDQHHGFIQEVVSAVYLERPYGLVYDFSQSFVGRFLGLKGSDLIIKIDNAIEENLAPVMLAAVHAPTLDEMHPNSSTMASINGHKSRLRKVAFYGVEDAPECWRVMSGVTDKAAEDYPIWEATQDDQFIKKMEKARAEHEAEVFYLNWDLRGLFPLKKKRAALEDEKKHREQAITFLNNANTQWRYLIGSLHRDSLENKRVNKYTVKWEEKYGWLGKWYSQERVFYNPDQAQSHYNMIPHSVYKWRNGSISTTQETRKVQKLFPSDGVVLKRSQLAYPGVGNRTDKMEGDNHFQERNSPETKRVMKNLYDGFYDYYFKTQPK